MEKIKNGTEVLSQISSETLFHFVRKKEYLKQLLKEGLWPRFCIEKNWEGVSFAIPMLCFCDIPLSQVKEHIKKYGSYGVGVTKSFARRYKLSPAIYLSQESPLLSKLNYYIKQYFIDVAEKQRGMNFQEQFLYYAKKVSGKEEDSYGKNYKFYNEREWRYVPEIFKDIHLEKVDNSSDSNIIEELSKKTINAKIKLQPDEIKYIIIERESEIDEMIKLLKEIEKERNESEFNRLCTRIITIEQIKNDF